MKKVSIILIVMICFCLNTEAQRYEDEAFRGTVRFKPLATLVSMVAMGGLDFITVVVPYVHPKIGIPVEVELVYVDDIFGFGLMTGFEFIPILNPNRDKSGLFINLEGGIACFPGYDTGFIGTSNIGYQLVSDRGFVFTPAVGFKHDSLNGNTTFNLMLDIGFAF
ncbi:MAG: hypothetical protein LBS16_01850 [Prevotellaceae bacterium]|jgi:hypothetical protein|nr:hypothetical protein [Prevotellaceae bacterium]